MIVRKTLAALASAGLMLGSTAAAAAPMPADDVRLASPVSDAEGIRGWAWIALIVAGLVVLGVTVLGGDDPQSP